MFSVGGNFYGMTSVLSNFWMWCFYFWEQRSKNGQCHHNLLSCLSRLARDEQSKILYPIKSGQDGLSISVLSEWRILVSESHLHASPHFVLTPPGIIVFPSYRWRNQGLEGTVLSCSWFHIEEQKLGFYFG